MSSIEEPAARGRAMPENVTILIADDEPALRFLPFLELLNSIADAEILQAVDGAVAVQLSLRVRPAMQIRLQSGDAYRHRACVRSPRERGGATRPPARSPAAGAPARCPQTGKGSKPSLKAPTSSGSTSPAPTREDFNILREVFKFHPLAIEDSD